MKTLLCGTLSLFLLATQAHAENRAGVLAGINIGKLANKTNTTSTTSDSRVGILGGVFYQLGLADGFYFEPQLRYASRGGKGAATSSGVAGISNTAINYLEIPLYAKYKYNAGGFMPFVFAGPNVAFKIGSNVDFTSNNGAISLTGGKVTNVKAVDLAVDAGLGAEFALTDAMNLSVAGSYSLGLTNMLDNAAAGTTTKHRGIQAYAALSWAY